MSWTRGRSPGWAAFDHKHRQNQGLEPEPQNDPYPPIAPLRPHKNISSTNNGPSERSFASVILPSIDLPSTIVNDNKTIKENSRLSVFKMLKELHGWADNSLIEDIMAAVDYDSDKASTLLKAMISTESFEVDKDSKDENVSSGKITDIAEPSSVLEGCCVEKNEEILDEELYSSKELSDDGAGLKLIYGHNGHLKFIPAEPEWEEDDVYLSHRKDAIKMMRSASQHSKAATNAFLRGDHFSAQHLSSKAQDEWIAADRLNAKAAEEILSIRNTQNDLWKLDLHGLHALEAVQALQQRLQKIENHMPLNRSVSPYRDKAKVGVIRSSSVESFNSMDMEKLDISQPLSVQRPKTLQVITGIGNHSRGAAALPNAVRSFLNDNRYRFDEPRPGVVVVRPKFRQR